MQPPMALVAVSTTQPAGRPPNFLDSGLFTIVGPLVGIAIVWLVIYSAVLSALKRHARDRAGNRGPNL